MLRPFAWGFTFHYLRNVSVDAGLSIFLDLVFIPPIEEILLTAKNITELSTIRKKNNERITVVKKSRKIIFTH